MFKKIETDEALIVERGVYRPAEVYEGPEGGLYAKAKGGFVRLKANGSTSHPTVSCNTLARDGALYQDQFGRLAVSAGEGRKVCALAPPSGDGNGPIALPGPK